MPNDLEIRKKLDNIEAYASDDIDKSNLERIKESTHNRKKKLYELLCQGKRVRVKIIHMIMRFNNCFFIFKSHLYLIPFLNLVEIVIN